MSYRRLARHLILAARKDDYLKRLENSRPDLDPEEEAQKLLDLNNPKKEKMALHWICRKTLRLPEDLYKLNQAYGLIDRFRLDFQRYDSPMEVINEKDTRIQRHTQSQNFDPRKEMAFSNPYNAGAGVVIYEVENSREGQLATRRAIDLNWGIGANPWCIAARKEGFMERHGGNWFFYSEEEQEEINREELLGAWEHWKSYDGTIKRIAFQNGKLLAFCANEGPDVTWWDRQDRPTEEIPASGAVDDDRYAFDEFSAVMRAENKSTTPEDLRRHFDKMTRRTRLAVARNPSIPQDLIEKILNGVDFGCMEAFLSNPAIKKEHLERMLESCYEEKSYRLGNVPRLISSIAHHPLADLGILRKILESKDESQIEKITTINKVLPEEFLYKLYESNSLEGKVEIAKRPDLTEEMVRFLVDSPSDEVRWAISRREDLPGDLVNKLAYDESSSIWMAISGNPRLSRESFHELAGKGDYRLLDSLLNNPSAPGDLLINVVSDQTVSKNLIADLLKKGKKHFTHEIYDALSRRREEWVRYDVAVDKNTPVDIIGRLARDESSMVMKRAIDNSKIPDDALYDIARNGTLDQKIEMMRRWPYRISGDMFEILSMDDSIEIKKLLASNENAPEDILRRLHDENSPEIDRSLLFNDDLPEDILVDLVKNGPPEAKKSIKRNFNVGPEIIGILLEDEDPEVRLILARNPKTPAEVLEKLAKDENKEVALFARRALDRLEREKRVKSSVSFNLRKIAESLML